MSTTFEQAREIAAARNAPAWRDLGNRGEYMVAPYGYENADAWLIVDGAREYLVDGDDSFEVMDKPLTLVMKDSGELFTMQYLENPELIDAMTPVGDAPTYE